MDIRKKLTILFFALVFSINGCSHPLTTEKYPDYSTPEGTFNTIFYARQQKDYPVMLESLSADYQLKYGGTKQEQLNKFKKYGSIASNMQGLVRTINNMEYLNPDKSEVKITWSEKKGSKYTVRRSWMYLQKINNEWKMIFHE